MTVFQVTSRIAQPGAPRKRRASRLRQRGFAVLRYLNNITLVGGLFALSLVIIQSRWDFILLPVALSLIVAPALFRNLRLLLVTAGLALVYYAFVTVWELVTHLSNTPEIIVVTTTLAVAIIFEPGRAALLSLLDQRFHLRRDATSRAIDAFTTSLREEIELDQVRERLLDLVQQ